jgi:hypothetical protein
MIYNQFRAVLILLCLTWAIVGPAPVAAAESTAANDLKIVLVPYGWLTGFSGTFGARGHETNVTNSFAQLDKYLNFAAMGHMEVIYRDTVGLIGEFNYARLGDQTSRKGVSLDGQMSFTMSATHRPMLRHTKGSSSIISTLAIGQPPVSTTCECFQSAGRDSWVLSKSPLCQHPQRLFPARDPHARCR